MKLKMSEDRFWAIWRLLSFVLIVAIAFFSVREVHDRQVADARAERLAALGSCKESNERIEVIKGVLLRAVADPPPESFDFIKDPVLKAGAIASGNRSRGQMRTEIETSLAPRDCVKEIPAPPEE